MAEKEEEYRRSQRRKEAYAAIAEAVLLDASHSRDPQQLGLTATIGFLSREGLLFAPLIEFPGEDARGEYVRNRSVDAVARLAVEHLQNPTVAATELVRTLATTPLPLQPIARQYIVGIAGLKAGDALSPERRAEADRCYESVIDDIAAMEEPKRNSAIDDVSALVKPLSYVVTWLERYGRS